MSYGGRIPRQHGRKRCASKPNVSFAVIEPFAERAAIVPWQYFEAHARARNVAKDSACRDGAEIQMVEILAKPYVRVAPVE